MKRKEKKLFCTEKRILIFLVASIFLCAVFVSAVDLDKYVSLCLSKGEKVEFSKCNPTNPYMKDFTCSCSSRECTCNQCAYIGSRGVWCPASPNYCNAAGSSCTFSGSNGTTDIQPPNITIKFPSNNGVYSSAKINFDLSADEDSYWYYSLDGTKWNSICSLTKNCLRSVTVAEGFNNVTIKAADAMRNTALKQVWFFVDSKLPKITLTNPKAGFADGNFEIDFEDGNPRNLTLFYGDSITRNKRVVNIASECLQFEQKFICHVENVSLTQFDGKQINYFFELTDIAGNTVDSKVVYLDVDLSRPVITNPNNLFSVSGKYVYFSVQSNDPYIAEVGYRYLDSKGILKTKKLCSGKNIGTCNKKDTFSDGFNALTVYVLDKTGKEATQNISFFIDSKKPSIKKVSPKSGAFSDGNFEIEFAEQNPTSLVLNYGTYGNYIKQNVNLSSCQILINKDYFCDVSATLIKSFDGNLIEYWFELKDVANNTVQSKSASIKVDMTSPVITNPSSLFVVSGKSVQFTIGVNEINIADVGYTDMSTNKYTKLCTRLVDGQCKYKKTFNSGTYHLTIEASDKAGNVVGVPITFSVGY